MGLLEMHIVEAENRRIEAERRRVGLPAGTPDLVFKFKISDRVTIADRGNGTVCGVEWYGGVGHNDEMHTARADSELPPQEERKRRYFGFRYIVKMDKQLPDYMQGHTYNNELYFWERDLVKCDLTKQ